VSFVDEDKERVAGQWLAQVFNGSGGGRGRMRVRPHVKPTGRSREVPAWATSIPCLPVALWGGGRGVEQTSASLS